MNHGESLKFNEEVHLDRSCEKWESITQREGGEECPIYNETKEGKLDWSHLAYKLFSETHY
jgi:hypothetical protein